MKKVLKSNIFWFLFGALIFGMIGGVSAVTILSKDIAYQPKGDWNVSNVEQAIDSLYMSKTSDNYSTSEKAIGTWTDGKTIYQKVFFNVVSDTQLLTGIDTVVEFKVSVHGSGSNADYHDIGDGFTKETSHLYRITNGTLFYTSWTPDQMWLEKTADFIIVQYTKN